MSGAIRDRRLRLGCGEYRVAGVAAGLDLEMPGSRGRTDAEIVAALPKDASTKPSSTSSPSACSDWLEGTGPPRGRRTVDVDAHHALAREVAGRSIVLLKNEDAILPLSASQSVASSDPSPKSLASRVRALADQPDAARQGSRPPRRLRRAGQRLLRTGIHHRRVGRRRRPRQEAVALAASKDVAVVLLGVPAVEESEGFDREHIDLPAMQLELLDAVLEVNPDIVVVLTNGGLVAPPFADRVPADPRDVAARAGRRRAAIADVLFGAVNPSGKLAETIPLRLEDTPRSETSRASSAMSATARDLRGLPVVRRRRLAVRYPFGHGLSYTTFDYAALDITVHNLDHPIAFTVALSPDQHRCPERRRSGPGLRR